MGCAKKIERSILKIRGVEGVVIDMAKNQVTIKGVVEPQAICTRITKKTKRVAKVLSPLPAAEGEPIPEVVASQVSGLTTVELTVNMHCEACAQQLKSKILKMKETLMRSESSSDSDFQFHNKTSLWDPLSNVAWDRFAGGRLVAVAVAASSSVVLLGTNNLAART
nr:heavy metal-associated isoprenylated plant protein 9 isoform X2 [Ipomoea trifida]